MNQKPLPECEHTSQAVSPSIACSLNTFDCSESPNHGLQPIKFFGPTHAKKRNSNMHFKNSFRKHYCNKMTISSPSGLE